MAARALTLRLKAKDGQHTLQQLTLESSLEELKNKITELTKIPGRAMKILKGFPPKPMDVTNNSCSLSDLHLHSGDTLIVEEDAQVVAAREEKRNHNILSAIESQFQAGQGILTRFVVPANNSCLFTSFNFVMEGGGKVDLDSASVLRDLIAQVVASDPKEYNSGFLGRSNKDYCNWIRHKDSWGGAIEISILSKFYEVEIDIVDTATGRIDRFGEDQLYAHRVLLIYDGVHYDPLVLEAVDSSMSRSTKFSTRDVFILSQALELAAEAKASRQFTDVARFTLRCLECRQELVGQTEAQEHAQKTGHVKFGEV